MHGLPEELLLGMPDGGLLLLPVLSCAKLTALNRASVST